MKVEASADDEPYQADTVGDHLYGLPGTLNYRSQ